VSEALFLDDGDRDRRDVGQKMKTIKSESPISANIDNVRCGCGGFSGKDSFKTVWCCEKIHAMYALLLWFVVWGFVDHMRFLPESSVSSLFQCHPNRQCQKQMMRFEKPFIDETALRSEFAHHNPILFQLRCNNLSEGPNMFRIL
jgi:hypothetical protein